jgi:hypothetical protein
MTDNPGSPLKDIRESIRTTTSLTLNAEIVGKKPFDLLKRIFPHQKDFVLSKCDNLSPTTLPLTFTGTFAQLFPWQNVPVGVCLFDAGTERHAVLRIPILAPDSAYAFLSQYSVDPDPDEPMPPFEIAPTTGLGDYVQNITFGQAPSHMIFSTLRYTAGDARIPDTFAGLEELPLAPVGRGLNFAADIRLARHVEYLDEVLRSRLTAFKVSSVPYLCLIQAGEDDSSAQRPVCKFTRAVEKVEIAAGQVRLGLQGMSIVLALARPAGEYVASRVLLEGWVTVSAKVLHVTAAFDFYFSELSLTFTEFPTLGQLLQEVGLDLGALPVPLAQVMTLTLSELVIGIDLANKSLSSLSFTIGPERNIELMNKFITFKPTLTMQIYSPLKAERSFKGSLTGDWTVEGIKFETGVAYPSLHFYARMREKALSTKGLVQRLMPGVNLPELIFTTMEIEGNVREKTFAAVIEAEIGKQDDKTWGFAASGLIGLRLGMVYANQQMTRGSVECTLTLAGVGLVIAAQYDAGQDGLQFDGRTTTAIDIASLMQDLGRLFGIPNPEVPTILHSFKIEALQVSFNTQSKDFTCTCDGSLTIEKTAIKGTVTLDLKHQQDRSLSTHFSGQITLGDGLQFALIFDKTSKSAHALATYHNLEGKAQSIQDLARCVSADLAAAVPLSLTFTLHDALLGYARSDADSKWLFGVDIEGGLNLSDVKLPDFPLLSQFAPPPDQTLKLAVQVVGAKTPFSVDEVTALNALNPGGLQLPPKAIAGLALAASLRLGQESKQLSLPIGLKKNEAQLAAGNNPLEPSTASDTIAATPHSGAQAVSDDGVQWLLLQKSFGPVHFERVGIAYKDNLITGLLDAALSVGGLTIALDGLSVTSPLTKFTPTFDLRGLGIDYRNDPLEIGGAFLKQTMKEGENTYTSFAGLAVLRTQLLSLSAIGSYALKDGHPSLFIYAVLDYPLGGPSFFFVTGLAAGFGYNRALIMPTIEQVESFPLVQQATSSGPSGNPKDWRPPPPLPTDQTQQQALLTARLEALEGSIPRAVGEHFLAIGLRFTSFQRINSFALLMVKFGKELEFDLLGMSTLEVPDVAYAQLALKATFNPTAGLLEVRAQLTPNSYLLSQACHLTGGFAFYTWFQDQPPVGNSTIRGGDFVLTLGGYHPTYDPPAHYPRVPRLGFNWQVDPYLQLKGDAYYAMTPHVLMAGGHLEATWHKDQLKAWFMAGADFVISWQPYHYDAHLYVDLGASYTFDLFGSHTITVDLGADLHLWGPEFAGEATIHWWIISFTVHFGSGASTGLTPIQWEAFKTAFLPAPDHICGIAVQQGLMRQTKIEQNGKEEEYWIVNPKDFVLVTNSVIPSTEAYLSTNKIDVQATAPAVRPAGVEKFTSKHTITITNKKNGAPVLLDCTPVLKAMPAALWGAPQFTDPTKAFLQPPDVHDPQPLIEHTLAGFEIRPPDPAQPEQTKPFAPKFYETERIPEAFAWEDWTLPEADLQGTDAWDAATGLLDASSLRTKNSVLQALGFVNTTE